MKTVAILSLLFTGLYLQAQDSITNPGVTSDIVASIKGQGDKKLIDIGLFKTGFRLQLSDSSFAIKHFRMTWDSDDGITAIVVQGDSVDFSNQKYKKITLPKASAIVTFDEIVALKDGKDYKISPLIMNADDIFNKHKSLKNPQICHNRKGQLLCYDDGTYQFLFDKNRFTGFGTADSLVRYYENQKLFLIKNTAAIDRSDSIVSIRLGKNFLTVKPGNEERRFDSLQTFLLNINGFKIVSRSRGRFLDSIIFRAGNKEFLLEIASWGKYWTWNIIERHNSTAFFILYHYKKNRPIFISTKDDNLRYGMDVSTRFRSHKKVWILESQYIEVEEREGQRISGSIPLTPSYYYRYSRFGKLQKKKTKGEVKYCGCK